MNGCLTLKFTMALVKIDQPLATQDSFNAHPPKALRQLLENLNFQGGCGGKIHVSPFCSQGNPTTTGPDQPCSAQPCARSDSQLGKAVLNRATSHLNQIFLGQIRSEERRVGTGCTTGG